MISAEGTVRVGNGNYATVILGTKGKADEGVKHRDATKSKCHPLIHEGKKS
jgi:hypothetical protein